MKARKLASVMFVLFGLTLGVAAQPVGGARTGKAPVTFGSVERTKLLKQVGGSQRQDDMVRLGSVERRAALTGQRVSFPLPQSKVVRRNGGRHSSN